MGDAAPATKVAVLGNRMTPGGLEAAEAVAAAVRQAGHEPVVLDERSPDRAASAVYRAVSSGADRVVAVGGDGVVSIAVNAVAGTATSLGIVPVGTGNDFARALGLLGGTLDEQVARALDDPVAVDAIRTTHGWVATVATIGFSGDVTARANALRWPRGRLRYSVATMLQLPRLDVLNLSMDVDGRHSDIETTLLAVGNTAFFGGGMRVCPGAEPGDGRLELVSIGAVSRSRFLRVFPTVFSGRHVERCEVRTDSGTVVNIAGSERDLWADGEVLGPLPVRLEVVPGALKIASAQARRRGE